MTQAEIKMRVEAHVAQGLNYSQAYRQAYKDLGLLDQYIALRREGFKGSYLKKAFAA
jgi:hypothetical protein